MLKWKAAQDLKPFDIVVGSNGGDYSHPQIVLRNEPSFLVDNFTVLLYNLQNDKIIIKNYYRMKYFLVKYEN